MYCTSRLLIFVACPLIPQGPHFNISSPSQKIRYRLQQAGGMQRFLLSALWKSALSQGTQINLYYATMNLSYVFVNLHQLFTMQRIKMFLIADDQLICEQ